MCYEGRWYVKVVTAASSRGTSGVSGNDDCGRREGDPPAIQNWFSVNARAAGAIQTRKEIGANEG
jgi:hypothetical protein